MDKPWEVELGVEWAMVSLEEVAPMLASHPPSCLCTSAWPGGVPAGKVEARQVAMAEKGCLQQSVPDLPPSMQALDICNSNPVCLLGTSNVPNDGPAWR
mmetsp:Transcript_117788/g.279610  ORF Transcript_117788/g.279610 Transcript_117788/m.279610 type:complete len:99 (+) Transcript_117788:403-699(+)